MVRHLFVVALAAVMALGTLVPMGLTAWRLAPEPEATHVALPGLGPTTPTDTNAAPAPSVPAVQQSGVSVLPPPESAPATSALSAVPSTPPVALAPKPAGSSSTPTAKPSAAGASQPQVAAILANLPAPASAVYMDLTTGEHAERNALTQSVAASVIKLPIAIETLRQLDAGTLPAGTSFTVQRADIVGGTGVLQTQLGKTMNVTQLLETTLTYSDNVGANMLLAKIGGLDRVNQTIETLGYHTTRSQRLLLDTQAQARGLENVTSAAETADMLARAYKGQLVNANVSREVIRMLKLRGKQTDPSLDFMGRQLAPRPELAHINGTLTGTRNDAGIVDGTHPYVLAIFIHDPGHDTAAETAIAAASAAIFKLQTA